MQQAKTKHRGASYRLWIFVRLFLFLALVMLVVAAFAWRSYSNNRAAQRDITLRSTQQIIERQTEGTLTSLRAYYLNLFESAQFARLTQLDAVPYNQPGTVQQMQAQLRGGSYLSQYVTNYTFLNVREGWIVDRYGMYAYADAQNLPDLQDFVQQQAGNPQNFYWLNRTAAPQATEHGNKTVELGGELLVIKQSTAAQGITSLLLIQIDDAYLKSSFDDWAELGYAVTVLDREKAPAITTNQAVADALLALPDPTAPTPFKVDGTSYTTAVQGLSRNGFYYLVSWDAAGQDGAGLAFFALVATLVIVLVLLVCLWFSTVLYKPVNNLLASVSGALGTREGTQDEFSYLAGGVQQLNQRSASLQSMVAEQQGMLKEFFLLHLLHGEVDPATVETTLTELNMQPRAAYRLLAFACPGGADITGAEQEALLLTAIHNLPDELCRGAMLKPQISDGLLLFLLGADEQDTLDVDTAELCSTARAYLLGQGAQRVNAGVSMVFHDLTQLHNAYFEAREALQTASGRAQSAGAEPVAYYTQPQGSEIPRLPYDLLLEKELAAAVNNCDSPACGRQLKRFLQQLPEHHITGQERSFYLYRIVIAMLRVANEAGFSANQVLGDCGENPFAELGHLYTTEELYDYLMERVATPVILLLAEHRRQNQPDLVGQITALVKQTQGDITLSECAEQLGYHQSYIWKVLKNQCNATFTDFINREKLEHAKTLLTETSDSVAEISEKLHYSNVQNFIRFFSKEVGVTPGKYRKQYRAQAGKTPGKTK